MRTRQGDKERDILDAAILVFGKEGYSNAKMHHIADNAGIGIGTVYLYFQNKEKILLRIFEYVWKELSTRIGAIRTDKSLTSPQKITALIDAVFDYFTATPNLALVFVNEQQEVRRGTTTPSYLPLYEKTLGECEKIIAEGQKNGAFNRNVATKFYLQFFFGGIRSTLLEWAGNPEGFSAGELKQSLKKVIFTGIAL
jgi:TetR/AcrR family transcriptional regulator, fatty acid metabolism regulator protein